MKTKQHPATTKVKYELTVFDVHGEEKVAIHKGKIRIGENEKKESIITRIADKHGVDIRKTITETRLINYGLKKEQY